MGTGFPKRAVHLDFHTMPAIYDVGRDFNPGEFAQTLKKAHVDYITIFARCNLGFAYYPTKVGTVHPGMKTGDMLGGMINACHKEGIRVAAYINAGLDHERALRHREWCQVNKEGVVYDVKKGGSFFRRMCLNTGYKNHLLEMIEEIFEMYEPDGLFLDCFSKAPCYGVECLDGMEKLGMDCFDEQQAVEYCSFVTEQFRKDVVKFVRSKNRDAYMCFNGLAYSKHPTHVEIEVLPPAWGYEYFPWTGRYARTLGKPFLKMTGRFHKSWGDFGGIRPEQSLLFDCYNAVANGGTCSVGDHMHPRGKLDKPVYDMIGRVYSRIMELEPWTDRSTPASEIAVLCPEAAGFPAFFSPQAGTSMPGAARMLMELKHQFDVVDGSKSIDKYRVVIIPENVLVDVPLKTKLKKHLEKGGAIISSASGGIDTERKNFSLEEYGISFLGEEPHDPGFFVAGKKAGKGIPGMPVAIYEKGVAVRAEKGTEVLCRMFKPYFNAETWDMRHWHRYAPPEKDAGRPALTRKGNIFHFSFSLFSGYYNHAVPAYRQLLGNCLDMVLPEPMLKAENLPSFAQLTLAEKGKSSLVHVLSYVPELRGKSVQVIEEPVCLNNIKVGLRKDGKKFRGAYMAPSREKIEIKDEGAYITATIPEINGYGLVVFE